MEDAKLSCFFPSSEDVGDLEFVWCNHSANIPVNVLL
jgi:hypothetical protein